MDSLCPRGCSETEVGARVPPGLEDTSLSQWTGIGRRTVLRPRCGTKALRTDAFADSGRRGLARESVNLDPAIALYDQPSQAYVTYLLSLSLSRHRHRHRRSILSRDFRARDYAARNLSLEFVTRIDEGREGSARTSNANRKFRFVRPGSLYTPPQTFFFETLPARVFAPPPRLDCDFSLPSCSIETKRGGGLDRREKSAGANIVF